ncbi:MAG: hypothetical protein A2664_01550 [Candidatus Taylorbacteria bacterium RIFCSPHIGHO2_01_FULL_46_22b]|uniref:Uncharacterized protein n=1 Tax=Candidatus Taylorbacteria bacterium RIFCSPHIGHO2_01_FULL_46_22b TaxID=1802301 RepID=A0A1G2M2Q1_9BACT|nr:MAG: hypothetical protein A2664_01550 [Candidatus Taylorbacteria bacterium RIFCSPHIGHO2_01_FULL_46_22b]
MKTHLIPPLTALLMMALATFFAVCTYGFSLEAARMLSKTTGEFIRTGWYAILSLGIVYFFIIPPIARRKSRRLCVQMYEDLQVWLANNTLTDGNYSEYHHIACKFERVVSDHLREFPSDVRKQSWQDLQRIADAAIVRNP